MSQALKACVDKLKPGYTRLPNTIMMEMINGDLSKAEMKILLLIARFTICFTDPVTGKERQTCSLSKRVIAAYTRVHGNNVLHAIQSLEKKGLIRKTPGSEGGRNQFGLVYPEGVFEKQPNLAAVPSAPAVPIAPALATGPENSTAPFQIQSEIPSELKQPSISPAEVVRETPPPGVQIVPRGEIKNTHPWGPKRTQGWDQKSTHYKQYSNNNINTLSSVAEVLVKKMPVGLEDYFKKLEPELKRKSEMRNFQALSQTYSHEDIAAALVETQKSGTPQGGHPVHSPMAFLTKGIAQVLESVKSKRSQSETKSTREAQQAREKQLKEDQELQEQQEFEKNAAAFHRAFTNPELKQAYIRKVHMQCLYYSLEGQAILKVAISAWANEQKTVLVLTEAQSA